MRHADDRAGEWKIRPTGTRPYQSTMVNMISGDPM